MRKISVWQPCYNEEDNVVPLSEAIVEQLEKLHCYDMNLYLLIIAPRTVPLLTDFCTKHPFHIKTPGIWVNSPNFYRLIKTGRKVKQ